ncbi:MAG: hypothetical protein M1827_004241 [Pycnora praestabilis]|nr:MAG: hypothetical protein M1827_004241 [Pycnora praestabilis]
MENQITRSQDYSLEVPLGETSESNGVDAEKTPLDLERQSARHSHALSTTAATRVVTAQDWTGPDDPENPVNWSRWKRSYHVLVPALFAFTVTFASSIYTPGYPYVMKQFHVSSTVSLLGLSLYLLGLAFGPMIAAPLSETHGRKFVYLTTMPIFVLFTLGAGFANNLASLLVCRFIAGMFGSPPLAVGAGSIADLFVPERRAVPSTLFIMTPFLGPAIGPIVGGFTAEKLGWRWTIWPILFMAVAAYILVFSTSETYKKVILQRRAKRLGIASPPPMAPTGAAALRFVMVITLVRPAHMLLTEPIVGFFSLYVAFNFSVLYAFFAAFPYTFETVYDFDEGEVGLTFISIGTGTVLAVMTVIFIDRIFYRKVHQLSLREGQNGVVAPEYRLYAAMLGSFGLPVSLFWFAWTARSDILWASPVVAAILFAWGNMCVFVSAAMYLLDTYAALNAASAIAANGLLRYILGAAFPLFTIQMFEKLGIDWATSLLGFLAVLLLPVPWVLFKWGHRIRANSAYSTIKA